MKKESATLTADAPQASPYRSAVQELEGLRKTLRTISQHYAKRLDMEIIRLRERVAVAGDQQTTKENKRSAAGKSNPGNSQLYDLRDMVTLLRTLDVKPLAGRRKDLKKIESLVDDLRLLIERWEE